MGSSAGTLQIPSRPSEVGWWTAGAAPGSATGTTVLAGHVDSADSGPGALFHLDDVKRGQLITVTVSGGLVQHYHVVALRVVVKSRGLDAATFAPTGDPRLVVISCGGPFDKQTLSYSDNIVVYARPA